MGRLALLFGLLIVAIIAAADTSSLGPLYWLYDFPHGDKAGHFVLYGILTLLCCLAMMRLRPDISPATLALAVTAILALLAGAEEISQRLISSRNPDLLDLLAGNAGMAAFATAAVWLHTRPRLRMAYFKRGV
jgi:VanZ family protein